MKKILLLFIAALTMTIASAKDIKTVVLTTDPQMHCEGCEKRIKENIRFEKGIKKIVTDVEHQTVTITYDADKTTVENIIKGFEKINYNARELKDSDQVNPDEKEKCIVPLSSRNN
jgi:copper chaperone CopZ